MRSDYSDRLLAELNDRMGLITLSRNQFLLMSVTLLLGVATCFIAVGDMTIRALYAPEVWGLPYQRELGFNTGWFRDSAGQPTCWGITGVTNGGPLEKAGVREGDVPWRFKNAGKSDFASFYRRGESGAITGFYLFLERSRGRGPVEFTVCSTCGPWGGDSERRVKVEVPAK